MGNEQYWKRKEELSKRAIEHIKNMDMFYSEQTKWSIDSSEIWTKRENSDELERLYKGRINFFKYDSRAKAKEKATSFRLVRATTQEALDNSIFYYELNVHNVIILNFASYKNAGGAFVDGSSAQEESICHTTNLFNILRELREYYKWNNAHLNKGMYEHRAIYTPDVLYFKDGGNVIRINVLTCAAPNRSLIERYNAFTEEENYKALKERTQFLKEVLYFCNDNCNEFITGAWGCGVFKQDPEVVARLQIETFKDSCVDLVTFAIPDEKNLGHFSKVFNITYD